MIGYAQTADARFASLAARASGLERSEVPAEREMALQLWTEAADLARAEGDAGRFRLARALCGRGLVLGEMTRSAEAQAAFREALDIANAIDASTLQLRARTGLGAELAEATRYDEALDLLEANRAAWRAIASPTVEENRLLAASLNTIAIVHRRRADYVKAQAVLEEAIEFAETHGVEDFRRTFLLNLSSVAIALSDFAHAAEYAERGLATTDATSQPATAARFLLNAANAYERLGEADKAYDYLKRAHSYLNPATEPSVWVQVSINLALAHMGRDHLDYAGSVLNQAAQVAAGLGNPRLEAVVYANIGSLHLRRHDLQEAIRASLRARDLARAAQAPDFEARVEINLGNFFLQVNDPGRALEHARAASVLLDRVKAPLEKARSFRASGHALVASGRAKEAIADLTQAVALFEAASDRVGLAAALQARGMAWHKLDQVSRATEDLNRARELARAAGHSEVYFAVTSHLGKLQAQLGNTREAETLYREVLQGTAGEAQLPQTRRDALWGVAELCAAEGRDAEALAAFEEGLGLWERYGRRLSDDWMKLGYYEASQPFYSAFVAYLLSRNLDGRAIEVMELSRTRALRDLLAGDRALPPGERVTELEFGPARPATASAPDLEARRRTVIANLDVRPPGLSSAVPGGQYDLAAMRELARDMTFLVYQHLGDRLAMVVLGSGGVVRHATVRIGRADLDALVQRVRRVLRSEAEGRATRRQASAALRRAYDLLVAPVAPWLPADPEAVVAIVPHGPLFLLPMTVLRAPDGRSMLDRHTLCVVPSIQVMAAIRKRSHASQPGGIALFGDPLGDAKLWPRLPGTRREVVRIDATLRRHGPMVFTGAAASEAQLRDSAPRCRVLHIAGHGYPDDVEPLRSCLVLSPTGDTTNSDGYLTAAEIFAMQIQADLVVLSACETGLGAISSDGVAGLSRAFLYAGANSLLVSLWDAEDSATAGLMVGFYRDWARHSFKDKCKALRQAQLRARSQFPHPYDWATFVLVGDPY
jgi:CHAT domain-containing protein/tetratricopeptide (TPR) repeat protein